MSRRQGFTLVELLVVIAIIAILAAIIFPVFTKVREQAETTQCISNVKNLTTAVIQYASNYDGRLPDSDPQFYNPTPPPGYTGWGSVIQPYLSNWQVFICPARKEMADGWTAQGPVDGSGAVQPMGYAYNGAFWQGCPGTGQPRDPWSGLDGKIQQTKVKDGAGTLMIADSSFSGSDELGDEAAGANAGKRQPVCQDQSAAPAEWTAGVDIGNRFYPEARHQEGYVVGFCDGHAKWFGFQYLYDWSVWTIEKDSKDMPAPPT